MRIVTLIDCYLPGYKFGGQLRTLANLVARMPAELEFSVLTRDRDLWDGAPYPDVPLDEWVDVGRARVRYLPRANERLLPLVARIRQARPDVVYSNSLFSSMNVKALVARRLGLLPRVPFILGPHGELSASALALKAAKKGAFLRLAAATGLLDKLRWQASTELEREEILASLRTHGVAVRSASIAVACDLTAPPAPAIATRDAKRSGAVRLVFISRISPVKQLDRVLELAASLRGEVQIDVYGPVDDAAYWGRCRALIAALPPHVYAVHHGAVEHAKVPEVFAQHDLFVFPTLGENFGHVIAEALQAGCPVAVSDRTPWSHIAERGAGWVLPLDDERRWRDALQCCVDMGEPEHAAMRDRARETRPVGEAEAVAQNLEMFRSVRSREDLRHPA